MSAQCFVCAYSGTVLSPELCSLLPSARLHTLAALPPDRCKQGALAEALLRLILSRQSGTAPQQIEIQRTSGKKPYIPGYSFSLSHTRGAVAVLLSGTDCGVDIERLRPARMRAARLFFTPKEYASSCDARLFWQLWTRKEALGKALGVGLRAELDPASPPNGLQLYTSEHQGYILSVCADSPPEIIHTTENNLF